MKKNRKVTANSVTVDFRNYGKITIPKGVLVTNETAMGIDDRYNFVDEFDWIDTNYPQVVLSLKMDAQNYGINIPKEHIITQEGETI
ncbi:hypothetical protein [uncultured Dysgonomonas sp.]|uniref:Uncharacterized protein n=1 Tax=uncultured Dysgonomonas sp. TaxID=206096 RepID=A0A212JN06_9BACT|nr:hypothetical protein [uncultured Dysgonomonas sp.]SBW00800.1 conserved hypothetical protein [uncultured Dysgonomonas sp.]